MLIIQEISYLYFAGVKFFIRTFAGVKFFIRMIEFNKALKEIDEMIKVHDIVQKSFSILREKYLSIYSITY